MDAITVRELLDRNTEEVSSLTKALNGEYVLPQAGGDLLRDGPGVLPTGRNIHALDPYRMPSTAAFARGTAAGEAILHAHADANDGALPETVAVNLWGLDSIKSRGDNVGLVLWLVGAQPVRESTGRIARFELVPLEELGRPRIDVLCNMSGIFRCALSCAMNTGAGTFGVGSSTHCKLIISRMVQHHNLVHTQHETDLCRRWASRFSFQVGSECLTSSDAMQGFIPERCGAIG